MNYTRLFKYLSGALWLALSFGHTLEAQNAEVPMEIQELNASLELAVFRAIMPDDREELYYLEQGQFYLTKRKAGEPWGEINRADSVLGIYVKNHWPALRDDLVKPFRPKSKATDEVVAAQNQSTIDNSASPDHHMKKAGAIEVNSEDYSFKYVLFYRNIIVEREFNQKDIDPRWAKENLTFTFNQTLKLTEMHQIMDALFLSNLR